MKHTILLTILILAYYSSLWAQTPEGMSYQAVARTNTGVLLQNQTFDVRINILSGSMQGLTEYTEEHTVTTNDYGVFTLQIGSGTVFLGDISMIDWGADSYFLNTEIDLGGGGNFVDLGTTQLLSVPYALYAKTAENTDDADADPTNELQNLIKSGSQINIAGGNSVTLNDDDAGNEIQSISKAGNNISLSLSGGSVTLNDDDAINELQTLTRSNDTVRLSNSGGSFVLLDDDPVNELQNLSRNGDTIRLSNSGSEFIDRTEDADADPGNEIQTISKQGNIISLSRNGGTVVDEVNDADADATNELQTLSRNGMTVHLGPAGDSVQAPEPFPIKYIICLDGEDPAVSSSNTTSITGEIKIFAGSAAPANWVFCQGQTLLISNFPELFSVIGTTYGGDGVFSFNVPDLTEKAPVHQP